MKRMIAATLLMTILTASLTTMAGNGEIGSAGNPASVGSSVRTPTSQATCSNNTYDYRIKTLAKNVAKTIKDFTVIGTKFIEATQGIDTLGDPNMKTGWERTITIVGSTLVFQSERATIQQDISRLKGIQRAIKASCSQYKDSDLQEAFFVELKKLDFSKTPMFIDLKRIADN